MVFPVELVVKEDSKVPNSVGPVGIFNTVFQVSGGVSKPDMGRVLVVCVGVGEKYYARFSGSMAR